jgi:FHS family L-fucose permease-like MFS transporter
MKSKPLPIFFAFLCMGFIDAVGPFVGLAKETFALSNAVASLIPFVGFIMFGLLSIPMGLLQDKKGKKFILILGLGIAAFGTLISTISGFSSYALFLVTVLLLGAGATTLQVAGNPIMRDVSDEGKYSRNLSMAQFVKAIGSLSGPVLPAAAALLWSGSWKDVFPIYAFFLALAIGMNATLKVREGKEKKAPATYASCFSLLGKPYVLMMVLAIFLYVGAEVCMSTGIPLFLKSQYGIDIGKVGILGTGLFFLALTIGRFLGGMILNWTTPRRFFVFTVGLSVLAILGMFVGVKSVALVSMFLVGLGFANIFPLVFSIAVDAMPERTNELSGLMVSAIVGGAILPLLMGLVADLTSTLVSFLVPLAAVLYIGWTSLVNLKKPDRIQEETAK